MAMPKATATFNDSLVPCMGISMTSSICLRIFFDIPSTSFPTMSAILS